MRSVGLACVLLAVVACAPSASPTPSSIGAEQARAIAIALFTREQGPGQVISDVTASTERTSGVKSGPNAGSQVWTVKVDGKITDAKGTSYFSHFWIEVDTVTGVPVVIGRG